MTLFSTRLARPALAVLMAISTPVLTPVLSPVLAAAQSSPGNVLDLLQLYQPSVTGSYMAGQQALEELRTDEAARYLNQAAQGDWDNPLLVERAFIALAADGQIDKAAAMARHLIELGGKDDLASLVLGVEALKERRYGAAERLFRAIPQNTFAGVTASILQGWALVGAHRFTEAEALLSGLAASGLDDFLIFHRALQADVAGERALALELAETAFNNEPYAARTVEIYARMLANEGRFEAAAAVIASFEERGLSHPMVSAVGAAVAAQRRPGVFASNVQVGAAEMFHGVGVALSRDGSRDLALVFLRLGLYLDPNADVIALAIGQVFESGGHYEAANTLYESVPAGSPMQPAAVVRVAQNLDATGNRQEAMRRLGNIVAVNPDNLDAVSVLGDLLRYDEQYIEAAAAYTKALELAGGEAPGDWRFYYVRAIAYERAKLWDKAEADFLKALELNPDQPSVLNYLGYSWIDQNMHLERALGMIEKAVEAQPQDGYIVDSLGWAFYKLERIEEAVATLERAVMLRPNDPEINDHLGDAYWKAGRQLEARFQWNIAKAMDEMGTVAERVAPKLAQGLTPDEAAP